LRLITTLNKKFPINSTIKNKSKKFVKADPKDIDLSNTKYFPDVGSVIVS
jgi:hypothetical protein